MENRDEVVTGIKAAYAKLDSYIIRYHGSAGEGKQLSATLAVDEATGVAVLEMIGEQKGEKMEMRSRATADDQWIVEAGGVFVRASGVRKELGSLANLLQGMSGKANGGKMPPAQPLPQFWLTEDSVQAALGIVDSSTPPWRDSAWSALMEEGELVSADEKTATFRMKDMGDVTLDRQSGLMVGQSFIIEGEPPRLLELVEVKINPGTAAVEKLTADWKEGDAKPLIRAGMIGPLRIKVFQALIDEVDEGKLPLEELEKDLDGQRDLLRAYAANFAIEPGGLQWELGVWKEMMDYFRDDLIFKAAEQGASAEDARKTVAARLADPAKRAATRDEVAKLFLDGYDAMETRFFLEFGAKEDWAWKARTRKGETARSSIKKALYLAYCEAVLEEKMKKEWDKN